MDLCGLNSIILNHIHMANDLNSCRMGFRDECLGFSGRDLQRRHYIIAEIEYDNWKM
jgi:hypothetical protein